MPITTSGAGADVTGTFTNSTATANGRGGGTITVFTTPNTANAIFIVNYSIVIGTADPSNLSRALIGTPGANGMANSTVGPSGSGGVGLVINTSGLDGIMQGSLRLAPNTALVFPVACSNGASASAATFSYRIRYDYVSIVVS